MRTSVAFSVRQLSVTGWPCCTEVGLALSVAVGAGGGGTLVLVGGFGGFLQAASRIRITRTGNSLRVCFTSIPPSIAKSIYACCKKASSFCLPISFEQNSPSFLLKQLEASSYLCPQSGWLFWPSRVSCC